METTEKATIVVPGDDPVQIHNSPHLERLKPYGEVVVYTDRPSSDEQKIERVKDADVVINSRGSVTWREDVLSKLPELKLIATCSIGTDMIDLDAARDRGIVVSNQPGRTA
ncbi:MAG: hypothetical protein QF886_20980, partial [Planctomycetota bacterium]|nr:hypothetical protein [Planctomycetota bacterium]